MLRLRATQGQDEANFGTELFRVNNDHTVEVPVEAVDALTSVGGFELIPERATPPAGMVHMAHPQGVGCSWGGVTYEPDADGIVTVPAAAGADLASHGFGAAPAVAEQAVAEPDATDETFSPDEDAPIDETEPTA